jgi:hypothetical protein
MSLMAIKNRVTSRVGRQMLVTRKHTPTMIFAVGVAGVVTTVVLASQATLKMEEVLEKAEKQKVEIDDALGMEFNEYEEQDAKKDSVTVRVQTALQIAKLYAPAFAVGVVSIGCLTGSHVLLSRRNVALTAAYAGLDKVFKEYRARVVDEFGHEKDAELRYGTIDREITVDTDDGPKTKTVKVADRKAGHYTFLFDESTSKNWQRQQSYNSMFLKSQQDYANDRLNANGHIFLSEVLDSLGLDRTPASIVTGWIKGNGDNYVDFGILKNKVAAREFINGEERSIWLEFNVDGTIYDKI